MSILRNCWMYLAEYNFILPPLLDPLSDRELDLLRLLNTHLSDSENCCRTDVSVNTVKTHIRRIYSKLNAGKRHKAVERAKDLNLL